MAVYGFLNEVSNGAVGEFKSQEAYTKYIKSASDPDEFSVIMQDALKSGKVKKCNIDWILNGFKYEDDWEDDPYKTYNRFVLRNKNSINTIKRSDPVLVFKNEEDFDTFQKYIVYCIKNDKFYQMIFSEDFFHYEISNISYDDIIKEIEEYEEAYGEAFTEGLLDEAINTKGKLSNIKGKIKSIFEKREKRKARKDKMRDKIKKKKEELEKKIASFRKSPSYKLSEAAEGSKNTYYDIDEGPMNKKLSMIGDPKKFYPYYAVRDEVYKYIRNPETLTKDAVDAMVKKVEAEKKKNNYSKLYDDLYYKSNHIDHWSSDETDWERLKRDNDNDNVITVTFDGPSAEFPKKVEQANDRMKKMLDKIESINKKYYEEDEKWRDFGDSIYEVDCNLYDEGIDEEYAKAWQELDDISFDFEADYNDMYCFICSYFTTITDAAEANIDILNKIGYYKAK